MTSHHLLLIIMLPLALARLQAASDTDVTILEAHHVVIEDQQVTIIAEALTTVIVVSADHDPSFRGTTFLGRASSRVTVKSDRATFIIQRSVPEFHDPEGTHARMREQVQKIADEAWAMTVQSATELKDGKPVGRIGYYHPEIVIKDNLIIAITGRGYLYPQKK